ncbi:MAG: hypothetical protein RL318_1891 [Fibrobacterota bacterium]|jgi:molybdopterin-guanine dinucleotide biosynthesis protein A
MAHEFVCGVSGFSGSGKTTLLEKLIAHFSPRLSLGVLKHDAHGFELDREGKDTWRFARAGAREVAIGSPHGWGRLGSGAGGASLDDLPPEPDWWFVEGWKDGTHPRLVLLDAEGRMEERLTENVTTGIVALLTPDEIVQARATARFPDLPVLSRDALPEIASLVESHMRLRIAPLSGLVLMGGKSRRMGQDKALLDYKGRPQALQAAHDLASLCREVHLSMRADQEFPVPPGMSRLVDRFLDFGPLGGILSAFEANPRSAWLVVACDMPLLTPAVLDRLVSGRDPWKAATALRDPAKSFPEPLATIWEPKSRQILLQGLAVGIRCPRRNLERMDIRQIPLDDAQALSNANDPQERRRLLAHLSKESA